MGPSPVKTAGTASASLSTPAAVTLRVLTQQGAPVRTLLAQVAEPSGALSARWDRTDAAGRRVAKGTYVLELVATASGGQAVTVKTTFGVS